MLSNGATISRHIRTFVCLVFYVNVKKLHFISFHFKAKRHILRLTPPAILECRPRYIFYNFNESCLLARCNWDINFDSEQASKLVLQLFKGFLLSLAFK